MRLVELHLAVLPLPVHVVDYARLVADFDATTRSLAEFVGVPWTEGAREFGRTRRGARGADGQRAAGATGPVRRHSAVGALPRADGAGAAAARALGRAVRLRVRRRPERQPERVQPRLEVPPLPERLAVDRAAHLLGACGRDGARGSRGNAGMPRRRAGRSARAGGALRLPCPRPAARSGCGVRVRAALYRSAPSARRSHGSSARGPRASR